MTEMVAEVKRNPKKISIPKLKDIKCLFMSDVFVPLYLIIRYLEMNKDKEIERLERQLAKKNGLATYADSGKRLSDMKYCGIATPIQRLVTIIKYPFHHRID